MLLMKYFTTIIIGAISTVQKYKKILKIFDVGYHIIIPLMILNAVKKITMHQVKYNITSENEKLNVKTRGKIMKPILISIKKVFSL